MKTKMVAAIAAVAGVAVGFLLPDGEQCKQIGAPLTTKELEGLDGVQWLSGVGTGPNLYRMGVSKKSGVLIRHEPTGQTYLINWFQMMDLASH